jgi:hypothetical protein
VWVSRLAGQLAIFKNNALLKHFWRRSPEMEEKLAAMFEVYFDELHYPEALHTTDCLRWLLVWAQFSDLDHEQSGFQFRWEKGRLFALNPTAAAAPPAEGAPPSIPPIVNEGGLLHFYRCKHGFGRGQSSTDRDPASPSEPSWLITVNLGQHMTGMRIDSFASPLLDTQLQGT